MNIKKISLLLLAATALLPAFAQTDAMPTKTLVYEPEMPYSGFRFSYGNMNLPKENALDYTDLRIGYVGAFPLAFDRPVYFQYGLNLGYNAWTDYPTEDDLAANPKAEDKEIRMGYIQIPLNVGYMLHLGKKVSLYPHAGVNGKFYALGNLSTMSESESLFGDDESYSIRRLHAGWQAGMDFIIHGVVLGVEYTQDFTDLMKNRKPTNPHAVTFHVGINLR